MNSDQALIVIKKDKTIFSSNNCNEEFKKAHDYFKRVFNGNDPMKKNYSVESFPDINKLVITKRK